MSTGKTIALIEALGGAQSGGGNCSECNLTDADAVAVLMETEILDPAFESEGTIYTANSGEVFAL